MFDGPALSYYRKNRPSEQIIFAGRLFDAQVYGFAFRNGSAPREPVNGALPQLIESGRYRQAYEKWFGTE